MRVGCRRCVRAVVTPFPGEAPPLSQRARGAPRWNQGASHVRLLVRSHSSVQNRDSPTPRVRLGGATGLEPATSGATGRDGASGCNRLRPGITGYRCSCLRNQGRAAPRRGDQRHASDEHPGKERHEACDGHDVSDQWELEAISISALVRRNVANPMPSHPSKRQGVAEAMIAAAVAPANAAAAKFPMCAAPTPTS